MDFDSTALDRMFEKGAEKGLRLVNLALGNSKELFGLLGDAVEAQDVGQIREKAHSLKSLTAQVGAQGVSDLFKEMEHAGAAGDSEKAQSLMGTLDREYKAFVDWLEDYKSRAV